MSQESASASSSGSETTPPGINSALASVVKVYVDSLIKDKSRFKKREPEEDSHSTERDYQTLGRMYGRQGDPFVKVDAIVNFGLKHETAEEDDENTEEHQETPENIRLLFGWTLLCSMIPEFCVQMLALAGLRGLRRAACQRIQDGASTARSDDSNGLKSSIPSYILFDTTQSLSPPIRQRNKLRNDRGFYHLATASLLCPVKYEDVPETYASITAGRLPITAIMLPRFLFPHDHVHDPADIAKDIFRGHVMLRAAKHILQGPTSALEGPGTHRGKQGNAAICSITTLTPHLIAYVATQVRFALSSTPSWVVKDGTFSYADFYRHIVELLDEDDEESSQIIKFYNHHVFGDKDPNVNTDLNLGAAEDDHITTRPDVLKPAGRTSQAAATVNNADIDDAMASMKGLQFGNMDMDIDEGDQALQENPISPDIPQGRKMYVAVPQHPPKLKNAEAGPSKPRGQAKEPAAAAAGGPKRKWEVGDQDAVKAKQVRNMYPGKDKPNDIRYKRYKSKGLVCVNQDIPLDVQQPVTACVECTKVKHKCEWPEFEGAAKDKVVKVKVKAKQAPKSKAEGKAATKPKSKRAPRPKKLPSEVHSSGEDKEGLQQETPRSPPAEPVQTILAMTPQTVPHAERDLY
ncbi:hypothetical protein HYPSUDRAFT_204370 [Hypholoma sublateritium FD-334 SS-4]|uniref:Uncharacterized protein n=1 Tax=Hypholoma sublateritium (strain FD-334 SS-4) TaxID=945553 RepID=A0A0D2NSN2_HYPSF|nr:hypothetical protein HYPSUDRAFT_204370 [Hypholoma sublateritium FD-334 SS-4]